MDKIGRIRKSEMRNSEPETRNPKPETPNPELRTPNLARKSSIALAAFIILCFALIPVVQTRIDLIRAATEEDELLYMPDANILKYGAFGYDEVVADLLWIRCIQYVSKHFKGDYKFDWLYHICNVITELDPKFTPVYIYGGIFLTSLRPQSPESITLLEKGMQNNPDNWEFPYRIGMIYYMQRKDKVKAAEYLMQTTKYRDCPPEVAAAAAVFSTDAGLHDLEKQMWQRLVDEADSDLMRQLARNQLKRIRLTDDVKLLQQAVVVYNQTTGKMPTSIEQLYNANLIYSVPEEPFGGQYVITQDGKVTSTTIEAARAKQRQSN